MLDEHLGYIADRVRSERFRQAIAQTIGPGDLVVDAGCGFGVLGLMCLQAGAGQVWGIDQTPAVTIARETMDRAGFGDRYTCVHESTFRATVPSPVDVIICDHVGYFGLDYGVVALLDDARRRLLKPGGKIMPQRIRLMLAGTTSNSARTEAEAWSGATVPSEYNWLRDHGINAKRPSTFSKDDIATAPQPLGTIDLRQSNPAHFSFKTEFQADKDGMLDGFAGWFECELADDVWMTNSPLAPDRIDRPQLFLAFERPIPVRAGDRIEASVSLRPEDGLVGWTVRAPHDGRRQKYSNWGDRALAVTDLVVQAHRVPCLSSGGKARQILYTYLDGQRTLAEIERTILADHPGLFPSTQELARFIRSECARSTI
jgi:protein arginine N-methyltransferase 1